MREFQGGKLSAVSRRSEVGLAHVGVVVPTLEAGRDRLSELFFADHRDSLGVRIQLVSIAVRSDIERHQSPVGSR
jgi:hypothetical protein